MTPQAARDAIVDTVCSLTDAQWALACDLAWDGLAKRQAAEGKERARRCFPPCYTMHLLKGARARLVAAQAPAENA